jgi:imidazole glycerol-phosphate synthase subunit HisF
VSHQFGSQCMVLSIEAKQQNAGQWEVFTDCGRERSGLDAIEWARRGVDLGAGEILVTAIDREGTRKGFDASLMQRIAAAVTVPVIASGGFGQLSHLEEVGRAGVSGIAIADALHFGRVTFKELRAAALGSGIPVRVM